MRNANVDGGACRLGGDVCVGGVSDGASALIHVDLLNDADCLNHFSHFWWSDSFWNVAWRYADGLTSTKLPVMETMVLRMAVPGRLLVFGLLMAVLWGFVLAMSGLCVGGLND